MAADEITVVDRPEERRYEPLVDGGHAGELDYHARNEGVVVFLHTEVDERFEGRGFAAALVTAAFGDVRKRGLRVVNRCPYVAAYIRRHPEVGDLLAPGSP